MKTPAVLVSIILGLALSQPIQASYLIQLKNGREFIISYYWQEGNQVLFHAYGGTLGIAKDVIFKIERSDRFTPESTVEKALTDNPPPKVESGEAKGSAEKTKEAAPAPKEAPKKDEAIVKEFSLLWERSARLNDLANDELYRLSDDLNSFKRKILASNSAENYKEELGGTNSLLGAVESLLKARTQ